MNEMEHFFLKRKRLEHASNQKAGKSITFLRSRVERVDGDVLQLFRTDALLSADDVLRSTEDI